jgi:hypothetical protein
MHYETHIHINCFTVMGHGIPLQIIIFIVRMEGEIKTAEDRVKCGDLMLSLPVVLPEN